MSPQRRPIATMDEVGGALLAIALVLCAVFIPTAFITGLQGAFYQQFAITIASGNRQFPRLVSLTLSPALAALLLKPREENPNAYWLVYRIGDALTLIFCRDQLGLREAGRWAMATWTARADKRWPVSLVAYARLIFAAYEPAPR